MGPKGGSALPGDQQWFNAAVANGGNPSAADKLAIAAFIQGCQDDGIWSHLDVVRVYATDSLATSCINVKSPSAFKAIPTASPPTFTAYRSVQGGTNQAMDEAFNPATAAGRFQLNDCSYGVWSLTEAQSNSADVGNGNARATLKNTSNQLFGRANDATNDTSVPGTSVGFFMIQRTNSSTKKYWLNGVQIFTVSRASTSITSADLFTCGTNNTGGSTREFNFFFCADSLAGLELALYNRALALLQALTGLTDFSGLSYSIYEGDGFEMALAAKDSDLQYSLLAGQDSALFSITDNVLTLPAKAFSSPGDADANNIYVAPIRITRTSTGVHSDSTVSVTVRQLTVGSTQKYIKPTGTGTQDGSTLANAAPISSLNTLIGSVGPGGIINIVADLGDYASTFVSITNGGGPSTGKITIRGVDSSLNPMKAVLKSSRTTFTDPTPGTPTSVSAWSTGSEMIRLGTGANNLIFQDIYGQDAGAFISVNSSIHGVELQSCQGRNVRRFFEMGTGLCVSSITIANTSVFGFSKQCVRMRGTSHNWTVDTCVFDSAWQNGDNFAVGFQMDEFAHDVTVTNCTMKNAYDSTNLFFNGDGFSAEITNYNITITGGEYSGNTDAGIDIKAKAGTAVSITGVLSKDNKNNIKLWGNNATGTAIFTLSGIVSREPYKRGGIGSPNHIDAANGANVIVTGASEFHDTDPTGALYVMENYPGSFHVASDTVEDSVKTRTSFYAGTTIDNVIP